MPKKPAPKKPVKKVTKDAKTPVAEPTTESTIGSLPTPNPEAQTTTVEPNTTPATESSPVPAPTTVTPVPPTPSTPIATPATPTDVPTIATEPDPTSVTANSMTSALPQATPMVDPLATTTTDTTDDFEPEHKGNMMKIVLIFLTALVVGGAAVAGFMYFSGQKSPVGEEKVVAPTQPPAVTTEAPIASESAETVEVASLSVQILNGSGTAGEAGRVRDLLEEAGFETFSLGNADTYDYTDTEVQVKTGTNSSIFEKVKEALTVYTVVEKDPLPANSDYDIVIFVGKQK